ncbi:hypothetical protein Patl1_36719 [Pistacia atlantica]|nr:hypothetical protein Patl1_36719 [Pistacia atlantica]
MSNINRGCLTKFFLRCGFSNCSFHFINRCVAPSHVYSDYEHHRQLFRIHLEIY